MTTRFYVMAISNPAAAGAAMVRHRRIPHRVVNLMLEFEGPHPDARRARVRARSEAPLSGLGGADPARAPRDQLSDGSAGIVAISR